MLIPEGEEMVEEERGAEKYRKHTQRGSRNKCGEGNCLFISL